MFNLVLTSKKVLSKDFDKKCCRYYVYTSSFDGDAYFYRSFSQLSYARLCILKKVLKYVSEFPGAKVSLGVNIEQKYSFSDKPFVVYHYNLLQIPEV